MATKYVCDRCHAESDKRTEIFSVSVPILIGGDGWQLVNRGNDTAKEVSNHLKDLCKPCLRLLESTMKPIARAGE